MGSTARVSGPRGRLLMRTGPAQPPRAPAGERGRGPHPRPPGFLAKLGRARTFAGRRSSTGAPTDGCTPPLALTSLAPLFELRERQSTRVLAGSNGAPPSM